jgi:hypothetical protein
MDDFKIAVLLLWCAEAIIRQRRLLEHYCDWPPSYGGDETLLHRIQQFLARPEVKPLVDKFGEEE